MEHIPLSELKGYTAVLGGSFDPIHLGHLHIASQVLEKSEVKELIFVPCAKHPFKNDCIRLSYTQRCVLIEHTLQNKPGMSLSRADEEGSGFTSHLMQKLYQEHPDKHFVFIIGSDNLRHLDKWHNFTWLASRVHFLILPRPDYSLDDAALLPIKASILPIPLSPISSTDIRKRIASGESIRDFVPPSIENEVMQMYGHKQG